ncbi:MAG: rhomboid family intramembrane serine protease [candidate division WOR-3 bacterium]|nr:rhomboid family intramembrane serine protease [candidate division WOR-3 bacterium]MCX7756817.1 rhomboid family intramembrane serine protease [candidate division WOR-3 bacterium]MDW7988014.1 rhomboid family intramembrane serine protease [candidate division WOR-3 bacterium]
MLPLRDDIPSERRPIITYLIVGANALVYLYELSLGPDLRDFFINFGVVPINILYGENLYTLFTAMFIHANFAHILGNMLYLWIFGDNVEDTLGKFWFIVMYLLSGLVGSFAHIFIVPTSPIPTIGASGAVSGVLGAYLVLYPSARILTLIPLGFFLRIVLLPAGFFLGFWIFLQLLYGFSSIGGHSGVAYFAHIGGFVVGLIFGIFFRRRRKIYYEIY